MEFNDVKTIAVIGAGNMGHGIALTLGLASYQVHLNSDTELSLQRGMDFIKADLDRLVALEMEEPARAQAALRNFHHHVLGRSVTGLRCGFGGGLREP